MSASSSFDLAAVQAALVGTRFAHRLRHFPSVTSTNSLLLTAAAEGAEEGTVFLADEQTAGRGRGGHTWHSAPNDGLYLSALIRSRLPIRQALWLSLATGLAAQTAVAALDPTPSRSLGHPLGHPLLDIRWPNDLLLGDRKCGGILVETAVERDRLRYAVIGLGLNLNQTGFPADLAGGATSLHLATGATYTRAAALVAFLRALDLELAQLEASAPDLLTRFAAASTWVHGKRVQVAEAGGYTGLTDGLDTEGFLRVRADDGTLRTVLSGGVRPAPQD